MKRILFVILSLVSTLYSFAQSSNVVLFTENGEKFKVILNGIRQNARPETNVKITSLNAEYFKVKIVFENQTIGEKNFNLAIEQGMESSYSIKKNSKGEYVLRLVNTVPVNQSLNSVPNQSVVVYSANPSALPSNQNVNQQEETKVDVKPIENVVSNETISQNTVFLKGYSGLTGCSAPMIESDFIDFKKSIESIKFEDAKMNAAKNGIGIQCFLVSQIRELMQLFSFEETKLELAKYAYPFAYDIGNYSKLNDVFTFETSIEEINAFIQSKK
jgi:hypothetical protein